MKGQPIQLQRQVEPGGVTFTDKQMTSLTACRKIVTVSFCIQLKPGTLLVGILS